MRLIARCDLYSGKYGTSLPPSLPISTQRYLYYINNGIDTDHVAPLEGEWLEHVLDKISPALKAYCPPSVERLSEEMREDYLLGVKKSIGKYCF